MSKIIKKVLIGLVVIAVLGSLGGNLYYFGWKKLEAHLIQKGANFAVGQIIQIVKQQGEIKLTEDVILIKKQ